MTPMVLASAYLGGAFFFIRVLGERRWNVVSTGFVSVCLGSGWLWYTMEIRGRRTSGSEERRKPFLPAVERLKGTIGTRRD